MTVAQSGNEVVLPVLSCVGTQIYYVVILHYCALYDLKCIGQSDTTVHYQSIALGHKLLGNFCSSPI